ncbi:Hypothetical protein FKW44_002431 [Caligus rogercresseyi]|uniref:Uncharacterized protein n=1 Tax=Caligus rogercresseyi TaxID=217165 RepID=A0A7T8KK70_CALRO|nr:Hypothetical protein FKW44_002431 [Caligus rogercresseyi]
MKSLGIENSDFTHRSGIFGHLDREKRKFLMTIPTHSSSNIYPPSIPLFRIVSDDYRDPLMKPPPTRLLDSNV